MGKKSIKRKPSKKPGKKKPSKRRGLTTTNNRISTYYPPASPVGYDKINYGGD